MAGDRGVIDGVPDRMDGRAGFALIAVLWLLVALSAIGVHAALEFRTERLAAANLIDVSRSREVASAGAEYARSRLTAAMLDRADELRAQATAQAGRNRNRTRPQSVRALFRGSDPFTDPWRDPDELLVPEMAFGDATFTLHVRDAAAALNLNAADAEMLMGFFAQGLGVDYAHADRLTQAILDWRDEDDLPRIGGAERDDYIRAGAPVLPRNGPFARVDELRHVMGMTPEIYEAAVPYLTLIGSGRVNVNSAPFPVLMAVPGMTPSIAQELKQLHDSGFFPASVDQMLSGLSAGAGVQLAAVQRRFNARTAFRTDEVEIVSVGRVEGSAVESRVRLLVARSDAGAVVVAREVD